MPPLRRHQLAFLSTAGWQAVFARDWPADVKDCLANWQVHDLPLVVTRQAAARSTADDPVVLGLAVPPRWGRHLLRIEMAPRGIRWFSEFPPLSQAVGCLPRRARKKLLRLDAALGRIGAPARVYGSVGWQCLTALTYVHGQSDLDLWMPVEDAPHADRVARLLAECASPLRVDGELTFPDGSAVAWREWQSARRCDRKQVLVKRLCGVALERTADLVGLSCPPAA